MLMSIFKFCGAGCVAAALLATLSGAPQNSNEKKAEIWSVREDALSGKSFVAEDVYTMQGSEPVEGVDYDGSSPLNSDEKGFDYKVEIENSICELENAMEESAEIMRSLQMDSSAAMFGDEIINGRPQDLSGMNIEEFEIQRLQCGQECISHNSDAEVIAKVDISVPKISSRAVVDEDEINEVNHLYSLRGEVGKVFSSATLKVVDILFDHGENERALSMLEEELSGIMRN